MCPAHRTAPPLKASATPFVRRSVIGASIPSQPLTSGSALAYPQASAMSVPPPLGRHRLFRRFILPYALLIVGTLTVSGWYFYTTAQEALDRELAKRLLTVAQTVRSVMNPRYLMQMRPGSEGTTLYALMLADLKRLQDASNASHIYLVDRQHRMLLDATEQTPIGHEYLFLKLDLAELDEVWQGRSMASVLYQGQSGRYYKSGYAPLLDPDGTKIGRAHV